MFVRLVNFEEKKPFNLTITDEKMTRLYNTHMLILQMPMFEQVHLNILHDKNIFLALGSKLSTLWLMGFTFLIGI